MSNCHITYVERKNQIISQKPGPFAFIHKMSINYLGENELSIKCDFGVTFQTQPFRIGLFTEIY